MTNPKGKKQSRTARISEATKNRLLRWADPEKDTMDATVARALDAAEANRAREENQS